MRLLLRRWMKTTLYEVICSKILISVVNLVFLNFCCSLSKAYTKNNIFTQKNVSSCVFSGLEKFSNQSSMFFCLEISSFLNKRLATVWSSHLRYWQRVVHSTMMRHQYNFLRNSRFCDVVSFHHEVARNLPTRIVVSSSEIITGINLIIKI